MRAILILCLAGCVCGCGTKTPDDAWIAQMRSKDASVRLQAIWEVMEGNRAAYVAVPDLIMALSDRNVSVRRSAAQALGAFGAEAKLAIPHLVHLLQDKNPRVRKVADMAIKRIDPHHF